jgi:hypothetical protein
MGHGLAQGLHESKEGNAGVLTDGKMETKVDRGRHASENGGRRSPTSPVALCELIEGSKKGETTHW